MCMELVEQSGSENSFNLWFGNKGLATNWKSFHYEHYVVIIIETTKLLTWITTSDEEKSSWKMMQYKGWIGYMECVNKHLSIRARIIFLMVTIMNTLQNVFKVLLQFQKKTFSSFPTFYFPGVEFNRKLEKKSLYPMTKKTISSSSTHVTLKMRRKGMMIYYFEWWRLLFLSDENNGK